jgi:putative photosynthetic complex assembly protein
MNAHARLPRPGPKGSPDGDDRPRGHFPRAALLGAGAVLLVVLLATGMFRDTDPQPRDLSLAHHAVELIFEDRADGAVVVRDARSGAVVEVFAPGTNGFVRGAMRGLARERKRREIGPETPFTLVLWPTGHLSIEDRATNSSIDLSAFGPDNFAPFARILSADGDAS